MKHWQTMERSWLNFGRLGLGLISALDSSVLICKAKVEWEKPVTAQCAEN